MSILTEELPKRLPISMLVSVALHGAVIAGLLFASFHQTLNAPSPESAINVSLVAPEVQPMAAKNQPQPVTTPAETPPPPTPEPAATPEVSTPKEPVVNKPVAVEKPSPRPVVKPPRHEVKKAEPKPQPKVPPKPRPEKARPLEKPHTDNQPAAAAVQTKEATQTRAQTAPARADTHQQSLSQGKPQALSLMRPAYPARALAFHLEGRVTVQFDVDSDGRVVNGRIIDAEPKNIFDREVRQAMKRWRFQSGKPTTGMTMNVLFKIDGSSSVE